MTTNAAKVQRAKDTYRVAKRGEPQCRDCKSGQWGWGQYEERDCRLAGMVVSPHGTCSEWEQA